MKRAGIVCVVILGLLPVTGDDSYGSYSEPSGSGATASSVPKVYPILFSRRFLTVTERRIRRELDGYDPPAAAASWERFWCGFLVNYRDDRRHYGAFILRRRREEGLTELGCAE